MRISYINVHKKGESTTSMIFARVGSRYEAAEIKGISHFLEHMCFKGSQKRTAKQIAKDIEKYGADINAFTDNELTAYWVKSANKFKKQTFDVVKDFVFHPSLLETELNKERNVIIQELKSNEDNPSRYIWDLTSKQIYNKNSGLYESTIGDLKSLNNIDRIKMMDFYKKYYNDLIIVRVGEVDDYTYLHDMFNEFNDEKILINKPMTKLFEREGITQANVIISNIIKLPYSPIDNIFAFKILGSVLNGMSGRLFRKIREEHNLVYSIYFYSEAFSCGTVQWNVVLGLDKDNIEKAKDMIIKELTRPVTKDELEFSVNKLIGSTQLKLDDTKTIANTIAYSITRGLDYQEFIDRYESNINNAASKVNELIEKVNFKNSILVGLVPK